MSAVLFQGPATALGCGITDESIDALRARVETRLDALVPAGTGAARRLTDAMRYGLLAPGKRIRPLLILVAAGDFGVSATAVIDPACALEMIHTASLVMDDLPAMDDALTRRGQPATHRRFGEDTAMLASIGLMNAAFGVVVQAPRLDRLTRLRLVNLLVNTVGANGLSAGQEADLHLPANARGCDALEDLNYRKTGVVFSACLEAAATIAGQSSKRIEHLRDCGRHLGLAFQLADDLLDETAQPHEVGKDIGQDAGKVTLTGVLGHDGARERLRCHLERAFGALDRAHASGGRLAALMHNTFARAGVASPIRPTR